MHVPSSVGAVFARQSSLQASAVVRPVATHSRFSAAQPRTHWAADVPAASPSCACAPSASTGSAAPATRPIRMMRNAFIRSSFSPHRVVKPRVAKPQVKHVDDTLVATSTSHASETTGDGGGDARTRLQEVHFLPVLPAPTKRMRPVAGVLPVGQNHFCLLPFVFCLAGSAEPKQKTKGKRQKAKVQSVCLLQSKARVEPGLRCERSPRADRCARGPRSRRKMMSAPARCSSGAAMRGGGDRGTSSRGRRGRGRCGGRRRARGCRSSGSRDAGRRTPAPAR